MDKKNRLMQMQLPIFPETTKLINSSVGFFKKDEFIYYLHNGSPIFCHHVDNKSNYRYIIGNLVVSKLCHPSELCKALGISQRNAERYAQKLRAQGMESFFNQADHRGECYKMTEAVLIQAQQLLDEGRSQLNTAKTLGVSESCIRYHLKGGTLKKTLIQKAEYSPGSTSGERNFIDFEASKAIGTGATRVEERIAASRGELEQTPIRFENCQSIDHAGVLLMLPALFGTRSYGLLNTLSKDSRCLLRH